MDLHVYITLAMFNNKSIRAHDFSSDQDMKGIGGTKRCTNDVCTVIKYEVFKK